MSDNTALVWGFGLTLLAIVSCIGFISSCEARSQEAQFKSRSLTIESK